MIMRAVAVKPLIKNSASLLDIPKPVINDSEILIKTSRVGIDGTDIEINQGAYGEAPENEDILVIGHEAVGEVVEIGAKVTDVQVGELVVPTVRRGDFKKLPGAWNQEGPWFSLRVFQGISG